MKPEQILREYELIRNQSDVYSQNLELIDGSLLELRTVINTLDEIKVMKKDSEMLVPIGADSFIKAKIIDQKNAIVGIGASISTKKTIADAKVDVETRLSELERAKADHMSNLEKLHARLRELEPSVRGIVSQATDKEV